MELTLTAEEKIFLLNTAREAITSRLRGRTAQYDPCPEKLQTKCGAFVTLNKKKALRGCIGQMVGTIPLIETVKEMALASAFQDPRFPPLRAEELNDINIEISVLTPLVRINNTNTIEVDRHGLYICRHGHCGVLLPQVATEHHWDRETFLNHTCLKAGLPFDAWKKAGTEISVFSAIIFQE